MSLLSKSVISLKSGEICHVLLFCHKRAETTVKQSVSCLSCGHVSLPIWITSARNKHFRFSDIRYWSRSITKVIKVLLAVLTGLLHQQSRSSWENTAWKCMELNLYFYWVQHSFASHTEWTDGCYIPHPTLTSLGKMEATHSQNCHLCCHPGLLVNLSFILLGRL
jgi:uncharacterized membrane protein